MAYDPHDTIAAIGTAPQGAARGMVRISGPQSVRLASACFTAADGRSLESVKRPQAVDGSAAVHLDHAGELTLPCRLFLWPGSRSYTRQPVAELHTIGSLPLVEGVLAAVCAAGARLAEPGEFTLRAFLGGRIDLTQAEAVLGVIDARDQGELQAALSQLAGGLARPLTELRDSLLQLLAELEAGLDFVDEDITFISRDEVCRRLTEGQQTVERIAAQMAHRSGGAPASRVVLAGPPNAGKSSLFNALARRYGAGGRAGSHAAGGSRATAAAAAESDDGADLALVSPVSGTTRDYLIARLEIDGVQCELVDTAGVAAAVGFGAAATEAGPSENLPEHGAIGQSAQAMAAAQQSEAAVVLDCMDAVTCIGAMDGMDCVEETKQPAHMAVLTKADLVPDHDAASGSGQAAAAPSAAGIISTSSLTGEGLDRLAARIRAALLEQHTGDSGAAVASTAARCREALREAHESLHRAARAAADDEGDELVTLEVREALHHLGQIVGTVYTDDLLDRIFSSFCIGK